MTTEMLHRIQFALTVSFHFIFPPISLGLGLILVIFGIKSVRTGDPKWRQLSIFWVKIYGLVFAMGIATGIVQEFEFGTNWSVYSRFVGNIFGSLLAAEGIFAFMLEGGFLGLMLFGGTRLGNKLWLFATSMVVLGATFSATWIVMANSWMQTPQGYKLQEGPHGQEAVLTSFRDVVFTPSFGPRIIHVLAASWMVGASLVVSVGAWYVLKKRHAELGKTMIRVALPVLAVLSVLQVFVFGANQAVEVTNRQPEKLAAMEGLYNTRTCAPMYFIGWTNPEKQTTTGLHVPCLLSFLATQDFHGEVQGLNAFPQDQWAPVNLVFQVYHLMIDLGMVFLLISALAVALWVWRRKLFEWRWMLWVLVSTVVLTELATQAGWWTAEFGRQPWVVWHLLPTSGAQSPNVSSWQVGFSIGMFVVLFALLLAVFLYLLDRRIKEGPPEAPPAEATESLPDSFGEIFRRRSRVSAHGHSEHAGDPTHPDRPEPSEEVDALSLNTVWFVLYVMIIGGYVVLDGFDLGVGMLSPWLARDDREKRMLLNSIGPVWDGNEVWLVLGGGALFAAFPMVYASLFSGFYLAMMLVLLVLILRTVAIEFRSKRESPRWRAMWDWFFFGSSLGITLLLGVALGNVIRGVAIDSQGNMDVSLIELLNPYSLAVGLAGVAMLCLHGAIFLTQKVEGELLERTKRWVPRLLGPFFVLTTVVIGWTLVLDRPVDDNYFDRKWIVVFPALALLTALVAWRFILRQFYLSAFVASAFTIVLLLASVAAGLYPVMLPSSTSSKYDLTVYNAASQSPTLKVMLVIVVIGMPFVVLYTAGVYYFFRGKVQLDDESY